MALTVAIVAVGVAATATYVAYEGAQTMAALQKKEAKRQAQVAQEREALIARVEKERIEYEANLAQEQATWETAISLEKAEYTSERIQEEAALVKAAQIVGYSASGLGIEEGSPFVVMARTAQASEIEVEQVMRGHEIFAEARAKEAAEVAKGGEQTYKWFMERLHAETGYEVASRHAEAALYKTKGRYASYGKYLSTASTLLGGAATAAGYYKGGPTTPLPEIPKTTFTVPTKLTGSLTK